RLLRKFYSTKYEAYRYRLVVTIPLGLLVWLSGAITCSAHGRITGKLVPSHVNSRKEPVSQPFCDLIRNSRKFRNKKIQTEAIAQSTAETEILYDPNCSNRETLAHFKTRNLQVADQLSRILGNPLTGPKRAKLTIIGYLLGPSRRGF